MATALCGEINPAPLDEERQLLAIAFGNRQPVTPESARSGNATPYGSQRDFASQYRRVFEAAACKTRAEPAAILDIRQSAISDAERRRAVPSDWLITLFEKKRINPEWVRMGQGGRTVRTTDETGVSPASAAVTSRPATECTTEDLMAEIMRRALKSVGQGLLTL